MSVSASAVVTAYLHLTSNYKFQTASYVVYVYDHILTFQDEVDKIWSQPLSFATLLFYIVRYVTHAQFIIVQAEFYETNWPISVCDRFVKFAGATTTSLVAVAEIILIIRVYCLYLGNKKVLAFLLVVWTGQVCAMAWAVRGGIRVPLPPGFPGCVLTGRDSSFAAIWAAPLVTDTCIVVLTLWRTLSYNRMQGHVTTMDIILRDGIIYFIAIFSVKLMNTLIYFLAVEDLKTLGASFSQVLTCVLVNRLQLNLRRSRQIDVDGPGAVTEFQWAPHPSGRSTTDQSGHLGSKTIINDESAGTATFFTLGNLGEELSGSFFDNTSDASKLAKGSGGIELSTLKARSS